MKRVKCTVSRMGDFNLVLFRYKRKNYCLVKQDIQVAVMYRPDTCKMDEIIFGEAQKIKPKNVNSARKFWKELLNDGYYEVPLTMLSRYK